jgi:hypothetical protein
MSQSMREFGYHSAASRAVRKQLLVSQSRKFNEMMGVGPRFEDLYVPVPECGCWIWIGCDGGAGYGKFAAGNARIIAHRLSFEIHVGPIPRGLFVCHRCDVPSCVNPSHLFLGTCQENLNDMKSKGRSQRGIRNGHVKLTEPQVLQIREALSAGNSQELLASKFGISQSEVSLIKHRKTWVHI